MPEQIKINNNTYLIYDFDRGRGPGMAELKNTRNDFIIKKNSFNICPSTLNDFV